MAALPWLPWTGRSENGCFSVQTCRAHAPLPRTVQRVSNTLPSASSFDTSSPLPPLVHAERYSVWRDVTLMPTNVLPSKCRFSMGATRDLRCGSRRPDGPADGTLNASRAAPHSRRQQPLHGVRGVVPLPVHHQRASVEAPDRADDNCPRARLYASITPHPRRPGGFRTRVESVRRQGPPRTRAA
jgi:hypothetical protein